MTTLWRVLTDVVWSVLFLAALIIIAGLIVPGGYPAMLEWVVR